jgi:aspartate/methionine/tyrosine aminotransferase
VSIAGGGRVALTRLAAALGNINMGHFLPDYTAYEELLSVFKAFTSVPILLDPEEGYQISYENLKREILGRGFKALLASNPVQSHRPAGGRGPVAAVDASGPQIPLCPDPG